MLSTYTIHLDKAFVSNRLLVQVDDNVVEKIYILDEEFSTTKKAMKAANEFIANLETEKKK